MKSPVILAMNAQILSVCCPQLYALLLHEWNRLAGCRLGFFRAVLRWSQTPLLHMVTLNCFSHIHSSGVRLSLVPLASTLSVKRGGVVYDARRPPSRVRVQVPLFRWSLAAVSSEVTGFSTLSVYLSFISAALGWCPSRYFRHFLQPHCRFRRLQPQCLV
jgi:hypothetical protein